MDENICFSPLSKAFDVTNIQEIKHIAILRESRNIMELNIAKGKVSKKFGDNRRARGTQFHKAYKSPNSVGIKFEEGSSISNQKRNSKHSNKNSPRRSSMAQNAENLKSMFGTKLSPIQTKSARNGTRKLSAITLTSDLLTKNTNGSFIGDASFKKKSAKKGLFQVR